MTARPPTDAALLTTAISTLGNGLWQGKLSDQHQGFYIPVRESLPFGWPWSTWWSRTTKKSPVQEIGLVFMLALDFVEVLGRPLLFPAVWLLWLCERCAGHWFHYDFYCPLCHNAMDSPFVFCQKCGRVQGRLAPSLAGLIQQPCAGCAAPVGPTLGNYFWRRPKNLICRDTHNTTGCYYPIPGSFAQDAAATSHGVIFGATLPVKQAVLAHLIGQALQARRGSYRIAWELNRLEWSLLQQVFQQGGPTAAFAAEEMPPKYTLARTFLLQRTERRVVALHNLAHGWLASENRLYTEGVSWHNVQRVVFVIDAESIAREGSRQQLTNAEAFSRVVRAAERYLALRPGRTLPLSVAVVLAVGEGARQKLGLASGVAMSSEDVEQFIARHSPATYALLRRTVPLRRLLWFGGSLPRTLDTGFTRWLQPVVEWLD